MRGARPGSGTGDGDHHQGDEHGDQDQLQPGPRPHSAQPDRQDQYQPAERGHIRRPPAGAEQLGHVGAADEADHRRARDHARQEAPGGGLSGARAEPGRGVPGDAGRRPCPRTEAGEDEGDEAGEEQQAALTAIPAVVACHVVSGEADFLVEIAVPDLAAYEQVLLDEILAIGPVRDVRSTFAIRTVLSRGPLPVDHRRLGG